MAKKQVEAPVTRRNNRALLVKLLEQKQQVSQPATSEALLDMIVDEFGGVRSLAKEFHQEWVKSPPGSQMRRSMATNICNLMRYVDVGRKRRHGDNPDILTDQELKELLEAEMERVANASDPGARPAPAE